MLKKIGVGLAALAAVAVVTYLRFIRPWQLRWGATNAEVERAMPGDDVVKFPTFNATRGVDHSGATRRDLALVDPDRRHAGRLVQLRLARQPGSPQCRADPAGVPSIWRSGT